MSRNLRESQQCNYKTKPAGVSAGRNDERPPVRRLGAVSRSGRDAPQVRGRMGTFKVALDSADTSQHVPGAGTGRGHADGFPDLVPAGAVRA